MKKILAVIICIVLAFALVSCRSSSEKDFDGNNWAIEDNEGSYGFSYDESTDSSSSGNSEKPTVNEGEKIIRTISMDIQTKEYSKYLNAIYEAVTAAGGYIENSEEKNGYYESSCRNAVITARIPCDKLDEFIAIAGENGKIVNKTENQKNVTLEYVDTQSRITAYKTEQAALLELLKKSENLQDTLDIQDRLSEVNYQLDSYSSQLRALENKVDYSTVTMYVDEVERVIETEPTMWQEIKTTFAENTDVLGETIRAVIVGIVGGIPVLIPTVLIIAAAILILVKLIGKARKKRRERNVSEK